MKFRSPSDQPMHVALTTGHTAQITPEGVELDPMFHKEASARGAIRFDDGPRSAAPVLPQMDRKAALLAALNAMLDGKDEDDFTNDGKPDLRKLQARVGFKVARNEADVAWAEVAKPDAPGGELPAA